MRIRNRFINAVSIILAMGVLIASAETLFAQGRYVGQYSRNDVDTIIRRLETSGDDFTRDFRKELDNSGLSSSQKRAYNSQAGNFENATDRLRSRFDRQDAWWESRSQVQDVITNARPLNETMRMISFRRNIERQWNRLRDDVNKLADTYDLPGIAGGGWSGGPWNPGNPGGVGNAPSWAVGKFYARHPEEAGTITLTIERNGSVSSAYNGAVSYGTINGSNLYMEGVNVRVSRIDNGIQGRRLDTGLITNYYRTDPGGGGVGNAPSWAVGKFYARHPEEVGTITLTIERNGRVSSAYNGAVSYGTINGTDLYMEGINVRVSRIDNGIQGRRLDTGLITNYYRTDQGGGNMTRPPSWARGTFRGRDPVNGADIALTISNDGQVTSSSGGNVSYGTYSNQMISMEGVIVRVERISNGIRTTRMGTGLVVDYRR